MAKKDISKFKSAMLSKTKVIKEESKKEDTSEKTEHDQSNEESAIENFPLDPILDKKLNLLSKKHNIDKADLVNLGIKFFLEYEKDLFSK